MADKGSMELLKGLKTNQAPPRDSSFTPKGGSVNDSPVREGVAKPTKTIGPRTA